MAPILRFACGVIIAACLASHGGNAGAQACVPSFVDVAPDANYCSSTEWLKQRAVTVGCDASHYCPDQVVTRGAMALFMQRLGTALTPSYASYQEAISSANLSGSVVACTSPPIPAANYHRTLFARGMVELWNPARNFKFNAVVQGGPSGGGLQTLADSIAYGWIATGTSPPSGQSISVDGALDIPAGQAVQIRMLVGAESDIAEASATANIRCTMHYQVFNANN